MPDEQLYKQIKDYLIIINEIIIKFGNRIEGFLKEFQALS